MCDLNFAVRSRYAASVSLCLARQSKDAQSKAGYIEIALDPLLNKTGDVPIVLCMPQHQSSHVQTDSFAPYPIGMRDVLLPRWVQQHCRQTRLHALLCAKASNYSCVTIRHA